MNMSNRKGAVIFVVLVLLGLLLGTVVTDFVFKHTARGAVGVAQTGDATYRIADCDTYNPCRSSEVRRKRQGVRKFKDGRLGRSVDFRYPAKAKDIIVDKLMRRQRQLARYSRLPADYQYLNRRQMWRKFKRQDTCFYRANPGSGTWATWSCDDPGRNPPSADADWDRSDVRAIICGTALGISIKGAMATGSSSGPAAPWVWTGIGAAWATCQWGPMLEQMAD